MRTGAQGFGSRSSITQFMVAMALIAMPTAGISVSAYAAPGGTPSFGVLHAPPPADPPTNAPPPSPPPSAPPAGGNGGDYYCGGCDGGAGGGGGGGG